MSEKDPTYRKQELIPLSQIPALVTPDQVNEVDGMPPTLRGWMHRNIQKRNRLSSLVQMYMDTGIVHSPTEALGYFSHLIEQNQQRVVMNSGDLFNGDPEKEWREIARGLRPPDRERNDGGIGDWGAFGTASHNAIRDLHGSRLPKFTPVVRDDMKQLQIDGLRHESPLFDIGSFGHMSLSAQDEFFPILSSGVLLIPDGYLSYMDSIRGILLDSFTDESSDLPEIVDEMYKLLLPIYGEHAQRLRQREGVTSRMLLAPAFLNWSSALLEWYGGNPEQHQILFTEAPLKDEGTIIGRIDAIEIDKINGKDPSPTQRQTLRMLSNARYTDAAHAIREVRRSVGGEIEVALKEYKFSTGDNGKKRDSFIDAETLDEGPIPSDVLQAQRYLVLATGLDFLKNDPSYYHGSWPEHTVFQKGELEYSVHTREKPFHFDISLDINEQLEFLNERIATRVGRAHVSAEDRRIISVLSRHLKQATDRSSRSVPRRKPSANGNQLVPGMELAFVDESSHQRTIKELLEAHRQFVDEQRTIEYTGRDQHGKPKYRLHLDAFLTGVQAGHIQTTGLLSGARTTGTNCLFPDHEDKSPSMHLWLDTGTFFCFGCRKGGDFDVDSVPDDFEFASELKSRSKKRKQTPEVAIEMIPEAHFSAMLTAQEILQAGFRDNRRAAEYLANTRCIDPGLAVAMGVGFSPGRYLSTQMKNAGMSEAELLKYGFMYTTRAGNNRDALSSRISYPLEVEPGKPTNFYGRSIETGDRVLKHWKLSTKFTNVPQGIFNVGVLYEDYPEIIAVEGTHDAMSLIQMGYPNVVAIIGTKIGFALELLARSGKDVAIGLDKQKADNKGKERELTAECLKEIEALGHTGRRRDFTVDFMNSYSDFANDPEIKDFNEYMKTTAAAFRT